MKCRDAPRRDALRRRSRLDSKRAKPTTTSDISVIHARRSTSLYYLKNERTIHLAREFSPISQRQDCDITWLRIFFPSSLPNRSMTAMNSTKRIYVSILVVMMMMMSVCNGAPSFKPRSEWPLRDDGGEEARAVLTSNCDPVTGRCWEWLPLGDTGPDEYAVEQDAEFNRGQPIHVRDVDQVTSDSWTRDTAPVYGRLAKKDMFMSRGWGAGGMPFSVLYMSPRANHAASGSAQAKSHKINESMKKNEELSSPLPMASAQQQQQQQQQSNYRVSLRNGIHGLQPRRHYSIIPQLFISYGWGPSGK